MSAPDKARAFKALSHPLHLWTDFPRFPRTWKTREDIQGESHSTLTLTSLRDLGRWWRDLRQMDIVVVHQSMRRILWLSLVFMMFPFAKKPVVLVDVVLTQPSCFIERVQAWAYKRLLGRVDHFIHYFRELNGYQTIYGISPQKSSYVPFKANLYELLDSPMIATEKKEEFVLAAGSSLRDYDTFIQAVSQVGCPAAIMRPNMKRLHEHGARFTHTLGQLPSNLKVLDNDGSPECWLRNLGRAQVVVIPIIRNSLRAAGISAYLDALLLGKCVIATQSPGITDVYTDHALLVPPEDPAALAHAIRQALNNLSHQKDLARQRQRDVRALGGEEALMKRILETTVTWYTRQGIQGT